MSLLLGSSELLPTTSSEQSYYKLTLVERLQVKLSVIDYRKIPCLRCSNVIEIYIVVLLLVSSAIAILSSLIMLCLPFQEIEELFFTIDVQNQWHLYISILHIVRIIASVLILLGILLRSPLLLSSFIPLSSFAVGVYLYHMVKIILTLIVHQQLVYLFDSIFLVMRISLLVLDLCHILLVIIYILWILHSHRKLCAKL